MKFFKFFASILLFLSFFKQGFSQVSVFNTQDWHTEIRYHYGFITPHHKSITYYLEDHINGIEINVGKKTRGEKYWHSLYNYPNIGFGYYHSNLANDKIFGKANAIFMYLNTRKRTVNKRVTFYNKLSIGLSHVSKKFKLYENHYNLSIGSNINTYLQGTVGFNYLFYSNFIINPGLSFTHISNGKFRVPNQGLNLLTASLGFKYQIQPCVKNYWPQEEKNVPIKNFTIISSFGIKQVSHRVKGDFFVSSWVLDIDLIKLKKRRFGFGFDLFYDSSTKAQYEFDKIEHPDKNSNYRVAAHLSYITDVGRTSFVVQPGLYLWNDYKTFGLISNRLGFRYRFTDHLLFNLSVKAHWVAIADYLEWGIGYAW